MKRLLLLALVPTVLSGQDLPYEEKIAGTTVSFEMVPVPGKNLWVGRTEVTWDLYDVFMLRLDATRGAPGEPTSAPSKPYGAPDYGFGHTGYPVISVTRAAAEAFCRWLSEKTGRKYRLPTEAEWLEIARLALVSTKVAEIAWHKENSDGKTHAVGKKEPDALGLFDLLGNAGEWVTTADGKPVLRGGAYVTPRAQLSADFRWIQDSSWNERDPQLPKSSWWLSDGPFAGFRIVREP